MELETVNKLFLELSQFATATTAREIALAKELAEVKAQREDLIADLAKAKVADDVVRAQLSEAQARIERLREDVHTAWSAERECRERLAASQRAVDAAIDFAGTVAPGASWWDDVWPEHEAALADPVAPAAQAVADDVVRDAAVGAAIERAAKLLPKDYFIELEIENGAATVRLYDDDCVRLGGYGDFHETLAGEINAAIDASHEAAQQQKEGGE